MQVSQILTLLIAMLIIAALVLLAARHRRRTHTYTQVMTIPTFTDSMPKVPQRAYEQARIAVVVADAKLILHRQYSGAAGTRRAMNSLGMSDRRWQSAVRLLRNLGIYAPHGFVPVVAEYYALRKLDRWQQVQSARVGHSPAYVASA